jgi:hypothetical protein
VPLCQHSFWRRLFGGWASCLSGADPDHDGIRNLMEFFHDGDPEKFARLMVDEIASE